MKVAWRLGIAAICVLLANRAQAQEALAVAPLRGSIQLDGKLDEQAWSASPELGPFSPPVSKAATLVGQTRFRMLRDDEAVYFGIVCAEPSMAQLKAEPMERDGAAWQRDCVEVFLDPAGRGTNYYHLMVTANNDQHDAHWIESGHTQSGHYSGLWESAVHRGEREWSVEIRVPLTALYLTPSEQFAERWKINVGRERLSNWEFSSWAQVERGFHEPAKFRAVGPMPRKKAATDVNPAQVLARDVTAVKDGYSAKMELEIAAGGAAAGAYRLSLWDGTRQLLKERPVTLQAGQNLLPLPPLIFAALGKHPLKVVLASPNGEMGFYFPLSLVYQPLALRIDEPFYANCIFPAQAVERIRGRVKVNLPAERLAAARVRVELSAGGQRIDAAIENGVAAFAFDAAKLAIGEYTILAALAGDDSVPATTATIRKLAEAPGACVFIDRDLNVVVDGKPVLVREWYGGTYMLSAALQHSMKHPNSPFATGLTRSETLEPLRLYAGEGTRETMDVEPSRAVYDAALAKIKARAADRELWFWYLSDEPECRSISPVYLRHLYEFVKRHDPYRPVLIVSRSPELYTGCADILSPHPYINPVIDPDGRRRLSYPLQETRRQVETVLRAGEGRITAWLTPQAFTYGFMDRFADYPTFDEYQASVWIAVAAGAKGFNPFIYGDHFGSWETRIGCDYVYETLAKLEPMLLLGRRSILPIRAGGDDLFAAQWIHEGRTLVAVVNYTNKPLDAAVGGLAVSELHGYGRERKAAVADGVLKFKLEPYETALWTDTPRNGEIAGQQVVRERIAAARASLKRPGNILFGRGKELEWDMTDAEIGLALNPLSLATLTDGMTDTLGFRAKTVAAKLEVGFPAFTPKFQSAVLHGGNLERLELWIWKRGEWKQIGASSGPIADAAPLRFDLNEPVSTVKMRIVMSGRAGGKPELYEIELNESTNSAPVAKESK